jgi:hypothetical protein
MTPFQKTFGDVQGWKIHRHPGLTRENCVTMMESLSYRTPRPNRRRTSRARQTIAPAPEGEPVGHSGELDRFSAKDAFDGGLSQMSFADFESELWELFTTEPRLLDIQDHPQEKDYSQSKSRD